MIDLLQQKINDENFKEIVETHLRKFINDVSKIKIDDDSNYRVLFFVRIVNMNTGSVIEIERS